LIVAVSTTGGRKGCQKEIIVAKKQIVEQVPSQVVSPAAELAAQRQYAEQMQQEGFDFTLVVAGAFVRGIRDIGYRHTGTALNELIDNSIQAGAEKVHIVFGYEGLSDTKPSYVAVLDDGHGMEPTMTRLAVVWGGTHRENDRSGFGRYGYGLPSACVSQGRRFTVVSRVDGGEFHQVTVDLDEISDGKYTANGRIIVPEPIPAKLPKWLAAQVDKVFGGMPHGTIILIDKLDKTDWSTTKGLEQNLLPHLGVTYRNYLRKVKLVLNDKEVEPVDPLFLTPGARFYDIDENRAAEYPPLSIEIKGDETGRAYGRIDVRFAYLPPTFPRKDKSREASGDNANGRLAVMKEHNGIIVCRAGRQIDVVRTGCPWTIFLTNDRYWGVEVNFPPTLDEEFKITTSKQQIGVSERIWGILKSEGVYRAIEQLRGRYKKEVAQLKEERERQEEELRASEAAMAAAAKFKITQPGGDPVQREQKSQEVLELEAARRAKESGVSIKDVKEQLLAETKTRPYRVVRESSPGAPFYRMVQMGGQRVLYINTEHRFYTHVYAAPESGRRLRSALEVLLFVLGEAELDSTEDRRLWYELERGEWSKLLNVALDRLERQDAIEVDEPDLEVAAGSKTSSGEALAAAGT
jgi:hypothetical protein